MNGYNDKAWPLEADADGRSRTEKEASVIEFGSYEFAINGY